MLQTLVTYRGKRWLREELNDRCGLPRGDSSTHLRVCNRHLLETQTKTLQIDYAGKTVWQTYEFDVITGSGMKSSQLPSLETKGVAVDRYMRNDLNVLNREQMMSPKTTPSPRSKLPAAVSQSELEEHNQHLQSELAAANLRVQQVVECHSADSEKQFHNPSLEKLAQLVQMKMPSVSSPGGKKLFGYRRIRQTTSSPNESKPPMPTNSAIKDGHPQHCTANTSLLVLPNISASEQNEGMDSLVYLTCWRTSSS